MTDRQLCPLVSCRFITADLISEFDECLLSALEEYTGISEPLCRLIAYYSPSYCKLCGNRVLALIAIDVSTIHAPPETLDPVATLMSSVSILSARAARLSAPAPIQSSSISQPKVARSRIRPPDTVVTLALPDDPLVMLNALGNVLDDNPDYLDSLTDDLVQDNDSAPALAAFGDVNKLFESVLANGGTKTCERPPAPFPWMMDNVEWVRTHKAELFPTDPKRRGLRLKSSTHIKDILSH